MSRSRVLRRGLALVLLGAFLLLPPRLAGAGGFTLEPAYPATPLKGPVGARGAVIWNHGINFLYGTEGAAAPVPVFVTLLRDAGWDVFRLLRPRMSEEQRASTAALVAAAARLKQQGYGRIVLAGQSGGAWLSLMAAGESSDIHAVIADAPAYYGADHPTYLRNGFVLFDYIDAIRRGRIMISYFKDDPYDPGGRGPRSDELLAAHDVPHLVIDQPDGFSGHSSDDTGLFLRRFGACVLAVAGDGPMPSRARCESDWGKAPSAELPLPPAFALAASGGGPAGPFLGKWYGYYPDGRELMLAIERTTGAEVEALYATGPGLLPGQEPAAIHRAGRVAEGALVFEEKGLSTLRFARRPDGGLDALWIAADGGARLDATLHRLP
ncbi:MAG: alpha/beta hydrolase [Stellaceae bacterium]